MQTFILILFVVEAATKVNGQINSKKGIEWTGKKFNTLEVRNHFLNFTVFDTFI